MTYSVNSLRSRISCCRSGILSMERDNSRTSHGAGLRSLICPSLPTRASMNDRGRNRVRRSLRASGSVSTMMITSRSAKRSASAINSSSWRWNWGSNSDSPNTMIGRAIQRKSSMLISDASKTCVRSSFQRSTRLSCAAAGPASSAALKIANKTLINKDIGSISDFAKSDLTQSPPNHAFGISGA